MLWLSITLGFVAGSQPMFGGVVGFELNDLLQGLMGGTGLGLVSLYGPYIFGFTPEMDTRLPNLAGKESSSIKESISKDNDNISMLHDGIRYRENHSRRGQYNG